MAKIKRSSYSKNKKSTLLRVKKTPYVKVAISMPSEDLLHIEEACRQFKLSRSKFMLIAVRQWFEAPKRQSLIDQYIRGYETIPEDTTIDKALEAIQSQILVKEDW